MKKAVLMGLLVVLAPFSARGAASSAEKTRRQTVYVNPVGRPITSPGASSSTPGRWA